MQLQLMNKALKIKELPPESRPREVFMRLSNPVRDMSDAMLLAILIRTGQKGSNAIDLANRLILHFGGAPKLIDATWQQIVAAKVPGVGKVAAVQLAAAFALVKKISDCLTEHIDSQLIHQMLQFVKYYPLASMKNKKTHSFYF